MKNLNLFIIGVFALFLAACSTQQDFTALKEYDDVYYQGSKERIANNTPIIVEEDRMDGASNAERSYYQNVPYSESEKTENEKSYDPDTDYYDENYANRIENFHRYNDGGYHYSNPYNTSPRMNMSFGYGMSPYYYGSSFSLGMRFGNGFYDPYYSNYYNPWYRPYDPYYSMYYGLGGYYSPYNQFYDPFYSPYYSPYRYGYYGYPYYGGYYGGYYPYSYYPYYGDYTGRSSVGVTSTPRSESTNVRPSRGGIITDGNNNGGDRSEMPMLNENTRSSSDLRSEQLQPDKVDLRRDDVKTREDLTRERTEQTRANREALSRQDYTRPGTTRSDYTRNNQMTTRDESIFSREPSIINKSSERSRITSPATRSSQTDNLNRYYNNQRQNNVFNSPSRNQNSSPVYQQRGTMQSTPSTPSRSYNNSSSPTRSSGGSIGGGGNTRSSSPSTPTRGSRR